MSTEQTPQKAVKHWQECVDVYDFLEQIQLRPEMWLPDGSLLHLQSILTGYRVALGVHGIGEPFDFWPGERFTQWLHERRGTSSSLTWAAEIERITPPDSTPVAEFFVLLDAFRHDVAPAPVEAVRTTGLPGTDFMLNTFVTLFWRRRLLTEAALRLEERGFRVVHLAAGTWATDKDMHQDFAAALQFPDYYGRNLDALNDCLGDVACYGPYDDSPEGAGLVLVMTDYDRFATVSSRTAQIVLDVIANQARQAAVLQRRFFALIHSNDPDIRFEPVGATAVMWNSEEWLDSRRR
jgi:hypothetical protein